MRQFRFHILRTQIQAHQHPWNALALIRVAVRVHVREHQIPHGHRFVEAKVQREVRIRIVGIIRLGKVARFQGQRVRRSAGDQRDRRCANAVHRRIRIIKAILAHVIIRRVAHHARQA